MLLRVHTCSQRQEQHITAHGSMCLDTLCLLKLSYRIHTLAMLRIAPALRTAAQATKGLSHSLATHAYPPPAAIMARPVTPPTGAAAAGVAGDTAAAAAAVPAAAPNAAAATCPFSDVRSS